MFGCPAPSGKGRPRKARRVQQLFDSQLALARKLRAARHPVAGADFLLSRAAEDLRDRLGATARRFPHAATFFANTPHAADALRASGKVDTVLRVEAHPDWAGEGDVLAEAETVPLPPESLDLAVSLLSLHETNDVAGLLIQLRRALKPDGLFLGAMMGSGTLGELRESLLAAESALGGGVAPRVYPFAEVRDAGGLLQRAGLALPVTDVEPVTVRYDSMFALLADLRAMGATSALSERTRRPATRALFAEAARHYAENFADPDGRIRATFNILWMSGWAPHHTQSKPLKPGSAQISLADALKKV